MIYLLISLNSRWFVFKLVLINIIIFIIVCFSASLQIIFKTVENIQKAILHLTWCLYLMVNLKVLQHLADLVCLYNILGCAFLFAYSSYPSALYHALHHHSKFRKNDSFIVFLQWKIHILVIDCPKIFMHHNKAIFDSKITFERSSIETDEIENIKDFY